VNQPVSGETKADASDFPYLKRDLVRLLGILCHNRKAIQDRIRVCGGISVVLNLCTIDDRNPCKFPFWAALARMLFCSCLVSRRMSLSHRYPTTLYVSAEADNENPQTYANMLYLRCEIYSIITPRTRPLSTRFSLTMNTWDLL
jgi:hypothetical protein